MEIGVIRIAKQFDASIFFDIRDVWKKALFNNSDDILLNRFEKDTKVPRVNPDKEPFDNIEYFKVFGPTVIATNITIDNILETRAVIINMPQSDKRFEDDIKECNLLSFKERLLAFRARHLGENLQEVAKPASGRLGDILRPILQVIMIVNPDCRDNFFELIYEIQNRKKLESLDSIEAQIITALINLEDKVLHGRLPVKDITDAINDDRPDRFQITSSSIGKRLSALGFDKGKAGRGESVIIYDINKINKLAYKYGILASDTSVTSVEPIDNTTEVSEMSEGNSILF